jgi:predicted ribosome quality control (RQC) complex YloA/Tae2 family protein
MSTYTGISTQMAEELCHRAALSNDRSASSMTREDRTALWSAFSGLMDLVRAGSFSPCVYYQKDENGRRGDPAAFAAVSLRIYADFDRKFEEVRFDSMSELLETFYAQKNEVTRIRQKSVDLRRVVQTILERDIHKYDLQCRQIKDTEKRDKYRVYGELLNAYGYSIEPGAKSCELDNYYTGEKIRVPLDPTLTPMQNAKRYFDRYTKLKRTNEALTELTAKVQEEIRHLESIRTSLDLATNEGDLAQIRQELEDSGFVKRHAGSAKKRPGYDKSGSGKKGRARTPVSKPLHYISSDGYDIYVGKNNFQNDALTFHFADPGDIWMHANDIPGSHVILRSGGRSMDEIPDRAFEEAASLAAWYSAGREQGKVEIDYLLRRNVKKPGGAKPGFVVYYTNYSILARADISGLKEAE